MRKSPVILGAAMCLAIMGTAKPAAAATPPYVYALQTVDGGANQIFGFRLDPVTGTLTALPGFPVATGGTGPAVTWAGQLVYGGGRLFALNDGSNTLSVFAVNEATGALTPLPFSPIALGVANWICVAVHPSGSPVIVGEFTGSTVTSFVVTATSATAAPGGPFDTHSSTDSCTFSRTGNFVYMGGFGNHFAGFSVASSTGVLTAVSGSPFDSGTFYPGAFAMDNDGRLFLANSNGSVVNAFATDAAGVPTASAGSPFLGNQCCGALSGIVHPAGFYMVAGFLPSQAVAVYRIAGSGAGTTLNVVDDFASGGEFTSTLAVTPQGSLLVAGNRNSRNLTVFRVNQASGGLTSLGIQPADTLGATGFVTGLALVPGPTAGDFDANGKADVLWRNSATGQNIGWLMNGTTLIGSTFLPTIADTNWGVKGVGDFNADARADVIWRNKVTGQNIVWLMDGLTVKGSAFLPAIADTAWDIQGVGDLDGDGRADVVWRNTNTGQNIAWLMNGTSVALAAFLPPECTCYQLAGVGDLDGDGKADLIWRHGSIGENRRWRMNGASLVSDQSLPTIADTNWEIAGVADVDGDGKADLVWRNKVTGGDIVWLMDGMTVVSAAFIATISDTNWEIKSVRDRDGDMRADIVWRNKVTGLNIVWLMTGFAIKSASPLPTIADVNWQIVGR
jgi:6-phosphogluconolactonase (cycloisomerase 2 family)